MWINILSSGLTPLSPAPPVFLTGSDRIPIHGMESLRIVIQSTTAEEHYLPVAHTCYNLLDMPRYQTKEILRCRLTRAVEQYEGFSLVWGREVLMHFNSNKPPC